MLQEPRRGLEDLWIYIQSLVLKPLRAGQGRLLTFTCPRGHGWSSLNSLCITLWRRTYTPQRKQNQVLLRAEARIREELIEGQFACESQGPQSVPSHLSLRARPAGPSVCTHLVGGRGHGSAGRLRMLPVLESQPGATGRTVVGPCGSWARGSPSLPTLNSLSCSDQCS